MPARHGSPLLFVAQMPFYIYHAFKLLHGTNSKAARLSGAPLSYWCCPYAPQGFIWLVLLQGQVTKRAQKRTVVWGSVTWKSRGSVFTETAGMGGAQSVSKGCQSVVPWLFPHIDGQGLGPELNLGRYFYLGHLSLISNLETRNWYSANPTPLSLLNRPWQRRVPGLCFGHELNTPVRDLSPSAFVNPRSPDTERWDFQGDSLTGKGSKG